MLMLRENTMKLSFQQPPCLEFLQPVNQRRNTDGPREKRAVDTKCTAKCRRALQHHDPSFITGGAAGNHASCLKDLKRAGSNQAQLDYSEGSSFLVFTDFH